ALVIVNDASGSLAAVLLSYVLLQFPSGILAGRAERFTLAAVAVFFVLYAVAVVLTLEPQEHGVSRCPPCVPNPLRITDLSVFPVVRTVGDLGIVASALAVAVLSVRRWYMARGAARRVLAPVLFGGVVTAAGFVTTSLATLTGGGSSLAGQIIFMLQILVPIGLAVTFVRVYVARGAVAAAIVQLGASPSTPALEAALRRSLGDPELLVARWSPAAGAYLDREGQRVDLDRLDRARAALRMERDGQPLAVVVHDAALAVDPALVASVADAVRFAVDTTDLRDRLRASGGDVSDLPRGQVAFLFGDVEGSTGLLAASGDAYVGILAQLRRIVREAADRHAGHVVDMRADECFVAFPNPVGAVEGAADIQRRLNDATWPAGMRPLMRIGLHLGTPELTADGYVGLDVHLAARVMATADGGQIVASAPVITALGGPLREGLTAVPLGYVNLKGIAEPEFLYRIVAASAG
ncbi:MAG TPA: adenylate/guanylate cyclase domain-containing protein, partial [Candidatus Binatia bacterium]|nr:adenylate/guanylate cyclase domain-containing protein [Candidatus Binatia bacterium]